MGNEELLREIDNAHLSANEAVKNKNFESYAEYFTNNLKYTQLNGRTIDKNQLMSDTAVYFNRVLNSSSDYKRISFEVGNETITERLIQKAKVAIRVFVLFSKKWTIEREAIYEWKKSDEQWKITRVEIISEKVL